MYEACRVQPAIKIRSIYGAEGLIAGRCNQFLSDGPITRLARPNICHHVAPLFNIDNTERVRRAQLKLKCSSR